MVSFSPSNVRRFAATFIVSLSLLVSTTATMAQTTVAPRDVALRVLIIAYGDGGSDPGLTLMTDLLDTLRTPYDVFNASQRDLTPVDLASAGSGKYNGIILTDTAAGWNFTKAEWDTLNAYSRDYGVRQSVVSGWPVRWAEGGMDYGLEPYTSVDRNAPVNARWLAPAGGSEYFEYVNASGPLLVNDFAYVSRPGANGPVVTPLLSVDGDPNQTLVALLTHADGREVLVSTITNAWFLVHSQVLAYEFLNFATKGVFLGARKVYFSAHVDDLFLSNDIWNSNLNQTPMEGEPGYLSYRMNGQDVLSAIAAQSATKSKFKTASNFVLDFVFNGLGADLKTASGVLAGKSTNTPGYDSLTAQFVKNRAKFRYISHTFTHRQMDRGITNYADSRAEIDNNRKTWDALKLPARSQNNNTLVTGNHSGLKDDNQTEFDVFDDTSYPEGKNDEFLRAAQSLGVRYLASDSSQLNQDIEAYVPGYNITLLPRWPSALFYNVTTPAEWTDEYNYIFNERYWEQGIDPATVPGAVAQPKTYAEILQFEGRLNFRHMLTYRTWPYFFHVSNLRNYNGKGATLLFDWINATISEYEKYMNLPLVTAQYFDIGVLTERRLAWDKANVTAKLDLATNKVTLVSNKTVFVETTGLAGGTVYGGQRHNSLRLPAGSPQTVSVDRMVPVPTAPSPCSTSRCEEEDEEEEDDDDDDDDD